MPVDAATAARAAVVLAAPRPWRLVELSLVDLPYAARAGKEGERNRAADWQQLGRPDDWHAGSLAGRAVVTCAAASEARGSEAAISAALQLDQPSRAVAPRAINVQLKAMAGD